MKNDVPTQFFIMYDEMIEVANSNNECFRISYLTELNPALYLVNSLFQDIGSDACIFI